MNYFFKRFREPSTYGALTGVLAGFGVSLDPGMIQDITHAGMGLTGILGFFLKDPGSDG